MSNKAAILAAQSKCLSQRKRICTATQTCRWVLTKTGKFQVLTMSPINFYTRRQMMWRTNCCLKESVKITTNSSENEIIKKIKTNEVTLKIASHQRK